MSETSAYIRSTATNVYSENDSEYTDDYHCIDDKPLELEKLRIVATIDDSLTDLLDWCKHSFATTTNQLGCCKDAKFQKKPLMSDEIS